MSTTNNSNGDDSCRIPELANNKSFNYHNGEMERTRKYFLINESSVKGIGCLFVFAGILIIISILFLSFPNIMRLSGPVGERFDQNVLLPEVAVANGRIVLFLGGLHIGIGWALIKLRNCARIIAGIFAIPGLVGIPIGTLISGYIIYSLFSKKAKYVCSIDYKKVISETPDIKCPIPIMIIIIIGILLFFNYSVFIIEILM